MTEAQVLTALRESIVNEAREWIGTPYIHQQSLKGVGTDCVGLVRGLWRACIGPEPEKAPAYPSRVDLLENPLLEGYMNRHMIATDEERLGDVVVLRMKRGQHAHHCAINVGDGMYVQAWGGSMRNPVVYGNLRPVWEKQSVFSFPGAS